MRHEVADSGETDSFRAHCLAMVISCFNQGYGRAGAHEVRGDDRSDCPATDDGNPFVISPWRGQWRLSVIGWAVAPSATMKP